MPNNEIGVILLYGKRRPERIYRRRNAWAFSSIDETLPADGGWTLAEIIVNADSTGSPPTYR